MITLIIDEERAKILQYVLNSAFNDGILEFLQVEEPDLMQVLGDFLEEWTEKVHEHDWCVDDKCSYKPGDVKK